MTDQTPATSRSESAVEPAKLRLAIFSDSFPERNGAGAYYADLADQLRPRLDGIGLFQPATRKRALNFALPLPGDSTQKLITPNVFRLSREYRQLKPHLVVAVTPGPFGLLGLWYAKRSGAGFITAFHTHFEGLVQMYGNTLFFKFAFKYLEFVNRILCKRSQTVLINNKDLESTVVGLGAPKVDVMGTPLSEVFLKDNLPEPPTALKQVIFAGRLAPEKNLSVVTQAARDLPDIRFVIAGDGPLRKEIEKQTKDLPNVRLTGWLDRKTLRSEVDGSDLLLLPSHMETFGTVALEAMARGRPALVAEKAGIHTWNSLSEALFVLKEGKPLKDALLEIAKLPPEAWQAKGTAARNAAVFLNNQTIDQWAGFVSQYARYDTSSDHLPA